MAELEEARALIHALHGIAATASINIAQSNYAPNPPRIHQHCIVE